MQQASNALDAATEPPPQTPSASRRPQHSQVPQLPTAPCHDKTYLGRVRALCARYCKPRFWIPLETKTFGDLGKVRTGETKHHCRPLPFVHDVRVNGFRLEDGLAVWVQHELQSSQVSSRQGWRVGKIFWGSLLLFFAHTFDGVSWAQNN